MKTRPLSTPQQLSKLISTSGSAIIAIYLLIGTSIAQPPNERALAPVINQGGAKTIPDQYIVVFKPGTGREAVQAAQNTVKRLGGRVGFTYTSALIGFSAKLPPEALKAMRAAAGVAYIEADQMGSINTVQPPNPATNPPTGLDRTSERLLPLDNRYSYSETGAGVHVYVLDTGIRTTHTEFGGRASGAFTAINDGGGTNDCHGHGTNVAGIIGGATFGIAKQVTLHAVRVAQCNGSVAGADAIAGVDWVTNNSIHPAVANMSLGFGPFSALDTSVTNSINSGVTYVIAAGNSNADACNTSPARVAPAITVGAIDAANDNRASFSNFGTCLDLFAPGVNILSAGIASDTSTSTFSGTSQATPHVAGVAARYLQNHAAASPPTVWTAIHNADDVATTAGWAGVINLGTGSPNELLHWGSLNDGFNDGDPHLTTVDGVHYDFQGAGEYICLRDGNGTEIQTRQSPVATAPTVANAYTGLASCVSLNTAVAVRVNNHRVTYEPNVNGIPDPTGLQLRVDGALKTLDAKGINLGSGGRVVKASTQDGIEIDFPDGTVLIATPLFWSSQGKWYLNISVFHTPASEGIMGALAPGSWLPALPNGTSLGPMPAPLHQRYVDLYQKFGDAWHVTDKTSLFDYAPGTSTKTFTVSNWPPESGPCVVPETNPTKSLNSAAAQNLCREIADKNMKANCLFDVTVTGEPGFAKLYLLSQRIRLSSTSVTVTDDKDPTKPGELVTFTALVARNSNMGQRRSGNRGLLAGVVQFVIDRENAGPPVRVDSKGQAKWKTSALKAGEHQISASYVPSRSSGFLASSSLEKQHAVREGD